MKMRGLASLLLLGLSFSCSADEAPAEITPLAEHNPEALGTPAESKAEQPEVPDTSAENSGVPRFVNLFLIWFITLNAIGVVVVGTVILCKTAWSHANSSRVRPIAIFAGVTLFAAGLA